MEDKIENTIFDSTNDQINKEESKAHNDKFEMNSTLPNSENGNTPITAISTSTDEIPLKLKTSVSVESGNEDENNRIASSDSSNDLVLVANNTPTCVSPSEPKLVGINKLFKTTLKGRWSLKSKGKDGFPKRQRSYSEMDIYDYGLRPDTISQRPLTPPPPSVASSLALSNLRLICKPMLINSTEYIDTDQEDASSSTVDLCADAYPPEISVTPAGAPLVVEPHFTGSAASGSSTTSIFSPDRQEDNDEDAVHRFSNSLCVPSSSNFSSLPQSCGGGGAGGGPARSAPATPLQEHSAAASPPLAGTQHQQHQSSPHRRSPHPHHAHKSERSGIKQLSVSAPSVSASAAAGAVGAAGGVAEEEGALSARKPPSQPSKARQKKFLRHFPQVQPDERVLNYYSCALVGDILLQGHLYITKNYFAFYSNVFGYVTKLLIPTASVLRVSKEKMARIIPNAVGVVTDDERHVFGSLLSRDSTYRLMLQVWKEAAIMHRAVPIQGKELRVSEGDMDASEYSMDEETSSGGEGPVEGLVEGVEDSGANGDGNSSNITSVASELRRRKAGAVDTALLRKTSTTRSTVQPIANSILTKMATVVAVALLALLALMAGVLIWRLLNHPLHMAIEDQLQTMSREDMYSEILKWQNQLHRKSANEVNDFLETNLDQIAKVRQSLEALSALMVTDKMDKMTHHEDLSTPKSRTPEKSNLAIDNLKS